MPESHLSHGGKDRRDPEHDQCRGPVDGHGGNQREVLEGREVAQPVGQLQRSPNIITTTQTSSANQARDAARGRAPYSRSARAASSSTAGSRDVVAQVKGPILLPSPVTSAKPSPSPSPPSTTIHDRARER